MTEPSREGRVQLERADLLADALRRSLERRQALVVLASLAGCPHCRMARDSYLGPLRDEQGYNVLQVDWGSPRLLRGFDGQGRSHAEQLRLWGIKVTPTVLFFGPKGEEIAPRLEGGYIPDYYGAYLDERLKQAQRRLRA